MTLSDHLETILDKAQRKALVAVLYARPDLTLEALQDFFAGRYGDTLRTITVGELTAFAAQPDRARLSGAPPIDLQTLELAQRSDGAAFDRLVYQAILEATQRGPTLGSDLASEAVAVSAGYLRARVGGPRWKLQSSLRRLVEAGQVVRSGVTSSTRYRAASNKLDS